VEEIDKEEKRMKATKEKDKEVEEGPHHQIDFNTEPPHQQIQRRAIYDYLLYHHHLQENDSPKYPHELQL